MNSLNALVLMSCWIFTETVAENHTNAQVHYRLENTSMCLHVRKPPPYQNPTWSFNNMFLIDEQKKNPKYEHKVELNFTSMTLCINKLTSSDSGTFEMSYYNSEYKRDSDKHQVVIQEMVPKPHVTFIPALRTNELPQSCNVSINCSVWGNWLESFCDISSCRLLRRSFGDLNISIYTENREAVCVGNNHVSTNNISKRLREICFSGSDSEEMESNPYLILYMVLGCLFSILLISVPVARLIWRKWGHREAAASALQTIQSAPFEVDQRSEPRLSASSSSSDAEHFYVNVNDPQPERGGSSREEPEICEEQGVDTIYNVPRASTTAGVGRDNVNQRVDTVYSELGASVAGERRKKHGAPA